MVTHRRRRGGQDGGGEHQQREAEAKTTTTTTTTTTTAGGARASLPAPPPTPTPAPALARRVLRQAFWPTETPVTPDYAPFVYWNALQGLCSYIRGVLASAAVFASLGVGDDASTPLAAATLTAARDSVGTLGGIAFAWLQGSSFDAAAKQWRLFADVLNDVALALDLASPLLVARLGPAGFLPVASAAALARALVGVAAGATGAALTHHFSRGGRGAAELSAKSDSRERAISIAGSLLGVGLARLVGVAAGASGSSAGLLLPWALFALLTWVHVWANVRAVRCLVLDTLTPARLELLLPLPQSMLPQGPAGRGSPPLPTPQDAAALETLVPPPFERAARRLRAALMFLPWPGGGGSSSRRIPARVRFGAPLGELLEVERRRRQLAAAAAAAGGEAAAAAPADVLAALRARSALPDSYLVVVSRRRRRRLGWGVEDDAVLVAVRRGADADARLCAFAHALVLAHDAGLDGGDEEGEERAEERAARWAKAGGFARWREAARAAGWNVGAALLPRAERGEGEW